MGYLGHVVENGTVRPEKANVNHILAFPLPTIRKARRRFLGMAGFYRRFCKNFSTLATSMMELICSSIPFQWTSACNQTYEHLEEFLTTSPVVWTPDHSRPFQLQIDASGFQIHHIKGVDNLLADTQSRSLV